jgi:small basic protein
MKQLTVGKVLPYILSILAFYAVTAIYFFPEVFEGKSLTQDDIVRYEGGSKEVRDFNASNPEPSMWTNSMFGGMPVYVLNPVFPDQPIAMIDRIFKGLFFSGQAAHMLFQTMLCMFIALAIFGVSPYIAAIAAAAFGLSTYNLIIIEVGHMTKAWAIAYAPVVLSGIYLTFRGKLLQGFALTALALALEIRANHLQITYYLSFVCAIYGMAELIRAIQEQKLLAFAKTAGVLLLAAGLAVAANAGRLLTTADYGKYSQRGKAELTPLPGEEAANPQDGLNRDYAFSWSQGIAETFTLILPNFYGGSNNEKLNPQGETYRFLEDVMRAGQIGNQEFTQFTKRSPFMYWGDQPFTNAPVYAGAIICFLFVWFLMIATPSQRYWMLGGVLLMFMFSWGSNFASFNYFMFDYFPGFNKFRSVSMALSLAVMLMVIGAAMGLQRTLFITEKEHPDWFKKLGIAFALTGGLCALFFMMSGAFSFSGAADEQFGSLIDAVKADRQAMFRSDAIRSFLLISAAAVLIYLHIKQKVGLAVATAVVGGLIVFDNWSVGRRYLNNDSFQPQAKEAAHAPSPADEAILKDKDLSYRVLNLNNPFNDAATSYYHKSVGGYFAAKLRRYQDLINRRLETEIKFLIDSLQKGRMPEFSRTPSLNMLNTRYLILNPGSAEGVLRNPAALGNAWFISELKAVNNADEEMAALANLSPDSIAVVDISKFPQVKVGSYPRQGASIKLTAYAPNQLTYESDSPADGFAVFSEIYYPDGWQVTIDGQDAGEFIRVNYVLRGLAIPKGKHTIVCRFDPDIYRRGSLLTMIASYLLVAVLATSIGLMFYRKQ